MLEKKEFLFFGTAPVMGYVDPDDIGTPLAPMVEREEFERWADVQGWEYNIEHSDGLLTLDNVTGLDPRSDPNYLTNRVGVAIEPDVLDTPDGEKELYDLTELAENGWVFSFETDQDTGGQTLRKGMFGIDTGQTKLIAYTPVGDRWNGWEKVFAEKEAIEKWLIETKNPYEFKDDGSLVVTLDGAFQSDTFTPIRRLTEDGVKTLYYMSGWCWDVFPLHGYYYQFKQNDAVSQKYGPFETPIYLSGGELRTDEVDCPLSVYFENSEQWIEGTDDSDAWDIVMIWYE
jgi:hypothetical protein